MKDQNLKRTRNIMMLGGVAVGLVSTVLFITLGGGNSVVESAEAAGFNTELPTAKVEDVSGDKLEAMRHEQQREDQELFYQEEGSSFDLLNSASETEDEKSKKELEEASASFEKQMETQRQEMQAEIERMEEKKKQISDTKAAIHRGEAKKPNNKRFDVDERREKNRKEAYRRLQEKYGKEIYPDLDENGNPISNKPIGNKKEDGNSDVAPKKTKKNTGFINAVEKNTSLGHDIRAVVHGEHRNLVKNSIVKLRLLDPIEANGVTIPKNTFVYGKVSFNEGRCMINVSNINYQDNVLAFKGDIYDRDGGLGINVPDNLTDEAVKDAQGNTVNSARTTATSSRTNGLTQTAISGVNSGVNAIKNAVTKKATQEKISISANYLVTIKEKK
ncbi:MAG: conjugative transposon protein TraM [Paludibacteraceae bacterium]|nr:conjugative transposon protein TraM [Paludibacteraceae bacterium]MBR6042150.1 conjugative transposon protein TraM [Paludibacteraceae bacterium]